LCFSLELIHVWTKSKLFNVWDIIPINGGFSNHFRCDGLITVFLCYFVWCVYNDRCNYRYNNAKKFDFLVIFCYLVASINMHFKSSEPNSNTLFFWQIKIQKTFLGVPTSICFCILTKIHTKKKTFTTTWTTTWKKNIKIIILIIYDGWSSMMDCLMKLSYNDCGFERKLHCTSQKETNLELLQVTFSPWNSFTWNRWKKIWIMRNTFGSLKKFQFQVFPIECPL
jgi:hypothetical protein